MRKRPSRRDQSACVVSSRLSCLISSWRDAVLAMHAQRSQPSRHTAQPEVKQTKSVVSPHHCGSAAFCELTIKILVETLRSLC